jgi:gliding motility-associated lipoprotein GldH
LIRILFIGSLYLLTLSACHQDVLNSEEWSMDHQQWIAGDMKSFTLEASDTVTAYAMDITLTHDAAYPYQNLYIKTHTTFPSGKEVESVTSIELINRDGSWAGDCSGKTCTISLPLQQRFTFPEVGTYTWAVEQYMRKDTIPGVNSFKAVCRRLKENSK